MSWDSYLDNLIAQTRDNSGSAHCDRACIIGVDGSRWTTDEHPASLKMTDEEISTVAQAMKTGDMIPFMAGGIVLEETKYQFLREEDKMVVFGKKKEHGSVTLQKSKTAVVIGHSPEGSSQGNLNKGVAVIADYLNSLGM